MAKQAVAQIETKDRITIEPTSLLDEMTDAELEAILKARKEAKAKLALENRAQITSEIEAFLGKKYNGLQLSDLGLAQKAQRKTPKTRTYKNDNGETYVYKGWGAVKGDILNRFGIKNDQGKLVLNPKFLQG